MFIHSLTMFITRVNDKYYLRQGCVTSSKTIRFSCDTCILDLCFFTVDTVQYSVLKLGSILVHQLSVFVLVFFSFFFPNNKR